MTIAAGFTPDNAASRRQSAASRPLPARLSPLPCRRSGRGRDEFGQSRATVAAAPFDLHQRHVAAPSVPHQPWPSCVIFLAWLSRRQRCAEYPKPWWHTPNACVRMRSGRARMAFNAESTRMPHGSPPSSGAFIRKLRKIARTPADHCRRTDNGTRTPIPERSCHGGSGKN